MTLSIPRNNDELARLYGQYIAVQVKHLNKRPENLEDILQSVWLKLVQSRVVEKFHERAQRTRPEALTTEEVCLHLGISVASWCGAQESYRMGDSPIRWMPTPVAGDPTSMDALWATDDIERYEATAYEYHTKVAESEDLIPRVTVSNFRTYLQHAIHNAFANWCRTNHRRNKERVLDCFVEGRKAQRLIADGRDEVEPFDLVTDPAASTRRMTAAVEARHTLASLKLGDSAQEFFDLLSEGYTAVEAARKLRLSRVTVNRINRVLGVSAG